MKTAYILVGVPGSGKSTWVRNQDWVYTCSYISTDEYVEAYARSVGKSYSEVFDEFMPKAIGLMIDELHLAIDAEKDIIWDQTSTTVKSRKKKLDMLSGYHTIAVMFKTPDPLELVIRLKNRPGKNVPQNVINDMISGFEQPTIEEGFNEIWIAQ